VDVELTEALEHVLGRRLGITPQHLDFCEQSAEHAEGDRPEVGIRASGGERDPVTQRARASSLRCRASE
jgi:hypothetical protein